LNIKWNRRAVGIWLLGSLLAIALIGHVPYVGLAVAVLSGVVFGLATLRSFRRVDLEVPLQNERGAGSDDSIK
jgi:uncharacterized membrane protein